MNEQQSPPLQSPPQHYNEDEINLVDILNVLWRQRWFITGVTFIFVISATVYVFMKTPLYEITAQIVPGITDFDENQNAVRNVSSNDIIAWFSEEAYADLFDKSTERLPKIKAKSVPKTESVKITYFHKSPSEGIDILNKTVKALINGEANDFTRELNVRKKMLNQRIIEETQTIERLTVNRNRLKFVDKLKIDNEIENANVKIKMLEKKIAAIRINKSDAFNTLENSQNEINRVNKNTEEIMFLRKQMVLENTDKIVLLIYSNIIQQNINFSNNLQKHLLASKIEINAFVDQENDYSKQIEYLNTQIRDFILDRDNSLVLRDDELKIDIEQRKGVIELLKMKSLNLSTIEINVPPVSSEKPEKPDRMRFVILAFIIGAITAVFTAFMRKLWTSIKVQLEEGALSL